MKVELPDSKDFWEESVHLPDLTLGRERLLEILTGPGIPKETMEDAKKRSEQQDKKDKEKKEKDLNKLKEQLETLTGKKIELVENLIPTEEAKGDIKPLDNVDRFASMNGLFVALSKQLDSQVGVMAAKQEQFPQATEYLDQMSKINGSLEQLVKAAETPVAAKQSQVAEGATVDTKSDSPSFPIERSFDSELYEAEILEVDGEPIQVYFPKGAREKLRARAKRAGKFTISDYVRSQVKV